ncbi:MAG: DNA primase [Deltaproteobacteria bacterium]|nr:DNA primase [Deltaproteobacteria bacterium]
MISADTIAKVRDHADIAAVVGETVKLTRRGRSMVGLCPFHKEKTPSFHVNPERGFFYCFGCHEKGDSIGFVMKTEGLSFVEAVCSLADRLGIEIVEDDSHHRGHGSPQHANQDLYDVSSLAAAFYEKQLREHPASRVAREELARRGLRPSSPTDSIADALQAFRIGYAPPAWDALAAHLKEQGVSPLAGERAGLLVPRKGQSGHYDRFRNRLMFAVIDVQGRVVAFSGRVLADPETGQIDKETGKYINSPESPIYRKGDVMFGLFQARQAIRQQEQAILVEGNFDTVALHARGIRNVVAPLGTAFTSAQARQLKRFTPRAVILFDGDAAGKEATRKAREPCREAGLDARVAVLPEGKDPDDFVREKGAEALGQVVAGARGMLEFLIDVELDREFAVLDSHDRAARVQAVAELIKSEDDPAVRALAVQYADSAASRLAIQMNMVNETTFRALWNVVKRSGMRPMEQGARQPLDPDRVRSETAPDKIPLEMLGCVIDCPEILEDPQVESAVALLEGEIALAIGLARNLRGANAAIAESFVARVPATIQDFAARRLSKPRHEEAGAALFEFLQNAQKMKRQGLVRDKQNVMQQLDRAGSEGDALLEDQLLREAEQKAREKHGL